MTLVYLILVRPFETILLNRLEIFNELMVLSASYFLYVYTGILSPDSNSDDSLIYHWAGYLQMSVSGLQIIVNIAIITFTILKLVCNLLLTHYR